MARVLEHSARVACPGWAVQVERLDAKQPPQSDPCFWSNTAKLEAWARVVRASDPGERLALVDADTFVLRDLTPVWVEAFDFAYTLRSPGRLPLNAGVVFVRVSAELVRFFDEWDRANADMYAHPKLHQTWRARYGGINQAALGMLLEAKLAEKLGVKIARLQCREWNCEDSSWHEFDPAVTRVVHLKSGLRRSVFGIGASNVRHQQLRRIWKDLERGAGA